MALYIIVYYDNKLAEFYHHEVRNTYRLATRYQLRRIYKYTLVPKMNFEILGYEFEYINNFNCLW
jgi:hypothetical protein